MTEKSDAIQRLYKLLRQLYDGWESNVCDFEEDLYTMLVGPVPDDTTYEQDLKVLTERLIELLCADDDCSRDILDDNAWMHAELQAWETEGVMLPKDADGIPIKLGDRMVMSNGDVGVVGEIRCFWASDTNVWRVEVTKNRVVYDCVPTDLTHHVVDPDKPLKKLLEKFWRDTYGISFPGDGLYDVMDKYVPLLQLKEEACE